MASASDAFQSGQILRIPNTGLKLPVQGIVRLQNTYYEFGTGHAFMSGVPMTIRRSEQALLAVNPAAKG